MVGGREQYLGEVAQHQGLVVAENVGVAVKSQALLATEDGRVIRTINLLCGGDIGASIVR